MNNQAKIVIVDDSAFMRKILMDILKKAGYSDFIECENGKVAVEKINSLKPDLVCLDIIMPEMDGIEVLKQIGENTNVLMISAIGQEKILDEAKDFGAKGFIIKPFDQEQVLGEIQKILSL